jgi:cell division protein FtsZ
MKESIMDYIEVVETIHANTAQSALGEVLLNAAKPPVTIKVVGVGGGGGNAVTHMIRSGVKNVHYITINTDSQALYKTPADIKIQLGENGQGAGANPNVARAYAETARPQLIEALKGADMVFITAGLGKGTGTGASAVVAQVAKEIGALTVCVVTKPFSSEGPMRAKMADAAADELGLHSDSLITVLNSKLEATNPDGLMKEWYQAADDVLKCAVSTIVEIIQSNGYQNVDFRDVVSVMGANRGRALMGTARAAGADRAIVAAKAAMCSQLLEEENLRSAKGVLINITASEDTFKGKETNLIVDLIRSNCADDVTPIYGTTFDDKMGDEIQVTVIVSGIGTRGKVALTGGSSVSDSSRAVAALSQHGLGSNLGFNAAPASVITAPHYGLDSQPAQFTYRTGTDDVAYSVRSDQGAAMDAQSLPLNLNATHPSIPTLTQTVEPSSSNANPSAFYGVGGSSADAGVERFGSFGGTGNGGGKTAGGAYAGGNNASSVLDADGLMLNPSFLNHPRQEVKNQVKALKDNGVADIEIPTFLRNQIN